MSRDEKGYRYANGYNPGCGYTLQEWLENRQDYYEAYKALRDKIQRGEK